MDEFEVDESCSYARKCEAKEGMEQTDLFEAEDEESTFV